MCLVLVKHLHSSSQFVCPFISVIVILYDFVWEMWPNMYGKRDQLLYNKDQCIPWIRSCLGVCLPNRRDQNHLFYLWSLKVIWIIIIVTGCVDLLHTIQTRVRPKYHIFGHIHEGMLVVIIIHTKYGSRTLAKYHPMTWLYRNINIGIMVDECFIRVF